MDTKLWQTRDLTLFGRTMLAKTLGISKLVKQYKNVGREIIHLFIRFAVFKIYKIQHRNISLVSVQ